jgi:HPt (histidine-containing phosphotransfer) domain-containing protein
MTDPLAGLRERFRTRCGDELEQVRALRQSPTAAELMRVVHNLAGAAGIFGFAALSAAAAVIDDGFASGRTPDPKLLDALEAELAAVADQSSSSLR